MSRRLESFQGSELIADTDARTGKAYYGFIAQEDTVIATLAGGNGSYSLFSMIISPSAISPYKIPTFQSGGAPFVGLLDLYPSAAAAYSVRRLSEVYSGSLMEVRRSSDNALQDIGFDANGDLDTTSLLSFVGEGDGFIRTWYDQSGNAYNATQTTTSAQPQIVSSGVISNKNSKPAIDFSGGNWKLDANAAASEFAGTDVNFESFSVLSGDGSLNKSFFFIGGSVRKYYFVAVKDKWN
jgi:hypothetical protein